MIYLQNLEQISKIVKLIESDNIEWAKNKWSVLCLLIYYVQIR